MWGNCIPSIEIIHLIGRKNLMLCVIFKVTKTAYKEYMNIIHFKNWLKSWSLLTLHLLLWSWLVPIWFEYSPTSKFSWGIHVWKVFRMTFSELFYMLYSRFNTLSNLLIDLPGNKNVTNLKIILLKIVRTIMIMF